MDCDISVVICTRDRPESLRETLACLASADREGLRVHVIVVDNAGTQPLDATVAQFERELSIELLVEPTFGVYGKSHALNRALDDGRLAPIVAILDDDMTPDASWFRGIDALCRRWPDADLFTGRSYVVWPGGAAPELVESGTLGTWMYSVIDNGPRDAPMESGRWFSGNHFWFRSRCLASGVRFDDVWLTEPKFMLDLVECGFRAISGPDAVVGHRIQAHLLDRDVIRKRAVLVGRSNAEVRLVPPRRSVKQAALLRNRPIVGRLWCLGRLMQAVSRCAWSQIDRSTGRRFVARMVALEQVAYYSSVLRIANRMGEYAAALARRRIRPAALTPRSAHLKR
jgi:glycosyltransferase involved in cell wall biosynthesis